MRDKYIKINPKDLLFSDEFKEKHIWDLIYISTTDEEDNDSDDPDVKDEDDEADEEDMEDEDEDVEANNFVRFFLAPVVEDF